MKKLLFLSILLLFACEIETDVLPTPALEGVSSKDSVQMDSIPLDSIVLNAVGNFRVGTFIGKTGHSVSGTVTVTKTASGLSVVFNSNFQSQSGPDLVVTLANNSGSYHPSDKELAKLKSFSGSQNYSISGINLSEYKYVHIWCKSFNPVFGSAQLSTEMK